MTPLVSKSLLAFLKYIAATVLVLATGALWLAFEAKPLGLVHSSQVIVPAHFDGFEWATFNTRGGSSKEAYEAVVSFEAADGEHYVVHAQELGAWTPAQREAYKPKALEAVYFEDSPGTAMIRVHHRIPVQKAWFSPAVFIFFLVILLAAIPLEMRNIWRLSRAKRPSDTA
jgi:hypothetical protein